jgi:L-lactate dehydrogenase complex protein LldF
MKAMGWVMGDRKRYARALRAARRGSAPLTTVLRRRKVHRLPWPMSAWTASRDAPLPAPQSFRDWWRASHGGS